MVKSITIDMNAMSGSEIPLRSVRRTSIELALIRNNSRVRYETTGSKSWIVDDKVIVLYDEKPVDLLSLINLDKHGKVIQDQILVYASGLILRSAAMSESKILKSIRTVASIPWCKTHPIQVSLIKKHK